MANDKFINPYAFVRFKPVSNRKTLNDLANEKTYTGCFEYTIELKTPLIIPNTSNNNFRNENNLSNSYGIYSYEDLTDKKNQDIKYQPVISGSEIRGCIRNVFEAMTNSCYNFDKNNELYFSERLNPNPRDPYKPGILKNSAPGEWTLYEADKYKYKDKINQNKLIIYDKEKLVFEMFEKVYAKLDENEFKELSKKNNGGIESYLTIGNKSLKNHICVSVFAKTGTPLLKIIKNDDNYKHLVACIKSFQDKNLNCTYQRYLDALDNNKTITIYYNKVNKVNNNYYRFSPAQIGRVLYNSSLLDKVDSTRYCNDTLCPACLLFGNINEQNSISSRVRFSDATIQNYIYKQNDYIDLISGTPHYSNRYFYSTSQSNQSDWDDDNIQIAGRKFYWHHPVIFKDINDKNNGNGNKNIKSRYFYIDDKQLKDQKIKFKGKVYFNDITIDELKSLYKSISLVDDQHCHKLGHGKPFGFGSCNFEVTALYCEDITLDDIRKEVKWENTKQDCELKYVLDYDALKSYINTGIKITYPFVEPNDEGFKWFVNNKKYPQFLKSLVSKDNKPINPTLLSENGPSNNYKNGRRN